MRWLNRIFNFYLDASIHVALAVFSLVQVTCLTFNISSDHHFSWFLFFGTISVYNFIKYGVEAEKYFLVANQYHKSIQIVSFVALGFAIYHGYFLKTSIWFGIFLLVFLTGLYAIPVLPTAKNLRSLGGLKIFVVALVWSGATVILPSLTQSDIISWDIWIDTLQRFLFVLILIIPFEIRDLKYDHESLRTLPQRYGIARTKIMGSFLVLIFFFSTFLKDQIPIFDVVGKGILFLLLGILMFITRKNQSKYFASFCVEGIPILWYLIIITMKQYFY
ncbi:hypothetical protein [Maribacter aestuarii]|uniref:hypothetical protein n=1 Tax=Maribacter aestuarii TaxID=1130723 RepID=UPI00248D26A2|nr:hypothetical protein [Maribacter aestuarii]